MVQSPSARVFLAKRIGGVMSIEERLATFARGPVAASGAREMMRLSLFDWSACGMAGVDEPLAAILRAKALEEGGAAQAGLIGGGMAPMRAAALVNGAVSHALDYDDTHFAHIGHPSVAVIPAALAVAEVHGAGLEEAIDAALIGAEGSVRVGLWLGRDHYQVGFHQTATAGAFGAALAAGRIMGLTTGALVQALGLAATRASGLKSQFGTMGKPYNAGIAAETGIEAADLAARGFTSSALGMSGPQGFGPTHAGAGDEEAFEGLGAIWRMESVSHKFHACCHGLHATIEALRALGLRADEVRAVTIGTHPRWLSVCNKPEPETGLGAKFSYRHVAAMVLAGVDTSAIVNFSDEMARRPDLVALRELVTVEGDARLSEMEARVAVTVTSGAAHSGSFDLDAPMSLDDRGDKLRLKAAGLLGGPRAAALWEAVRAPDLAPLTKLLQTRS
jgi:2-methylcitrate dehydratase PrpD